MRHFIYTVTKNVFFQIFSKICWEVVLTLLVLVMRQKGVVTILVSKLQTVEVAEFFRFVCMKIAKSNIISGLKSMGTHNFFCLKTFHLHGRTSC